MHQSRAKITRNNDEYYTQPQMWDKIIDLLDKDKIIFEAFYGDGHTYKYFHTNGYKIIGEKGMDFFSDKGMEYLQRCDYVVSNPPFSKKYKILKTIVEYQKPFILILPLSSVNTLSFRDCFDGKMNHVSLLIPKGRMKFIKDGNVKKSPSFETCFVCYKMLADKLVFLD